MTDEAETKPKDTARSKHRKSTCAGCRRRKSKCDGRMPKCTTCIAYKDECHYDKPPSLAYVRSLEDEIVQLKQQLRQARTQAWLTKTMSNDEKKPFSSPSPSEEVPKPGLDQKTIPRRGSRPIKWEADITIDEQGSLTFHNSTSATYDPPVGPEISATVAPSAQNTTMTGGIEEENVKRALVLNAQNQRQWEDYAVGNTAFKINISKEDSDELLKYHWCWIHPLFIFVYRPAFVRGMAMVNTSSPDARDPPYFSESLLKVMISHCARFLNHPVHKKPGSVSPIQDNSASPTWSQAEFMKRSTEEARYCLGLDTMKPSAIPTIQALLQQSAREIVFGRSSQGWLYSGMAFRMALDMGIHLPTNYLQRYVKSLTQEDIEIRKRLFWSCYTWDKTISIYLGRMPNFLPDVECVPLDFMDDFSDNELWTPYFGEISSDADVKPPQYPPTRGYVVACFRQMCKLSIIINDLIHGLYFPTATTRADPDESEQPDNEKPASDIPFIKVCMELKEWWTQLPTYLRISPDQMPLLAPPSHIVSLNVLYQTTIILLHRPYILEAKDLTQSAVQKSYTACTSATAAIHDLLLLQAATFGFSHLTYLNSYAAYIAATIAVLRLEREHKPDQDINNEIRDLGLNFFLEVLQGTAISMPALERSVAIIKKRLTSVLERLKKNQVQSLFPGPATQPAAFNIVTTQQQQLAQPTIFQALSNPYVSHNQQHEPQSSFVNSPTTTIPMQWQSNVRSNIYQTHHPFTAEEYLPAFPAQTFPVGSEHSFGSEGGVDPQARVALMGFNLDPHPRLHHGDFDWTFVDPYAS